MLFRGQIRHSHCQNCPGIEHGECGENKFRAIRKQDQYTLSMQVRVQVLHDVAISAGCFLHLGVCVRLSSVNHGNFGALAFLQPI
jgi:hypothetical protein